MNASNSIVLNGGNIYCYSSGNDGIDSNGTLTITGGVIVSSGTTSPEDGFDCDQNTFKITGGIVLGIGGGTSTPTSSVCTQRTVIYGGSGSNGEILNIQSADGTSVLTYQIPRAYSQMTVLFSSPNLTSGGSYTISKGGTVFRWFRVLRVIFGSHLFRWHAGGNIYCQFDGDTSRQHFRRWPARWWRRWTWTWWMGMVNSSLPSKSVLWSILFVIKQVRFYLCFDNQKQ